MEEKIEIEKSHQIDQANLPELKITALNDTAIKCVMFENMFVTQVHNKSLTDKVKFGHQLELVCRKARDKILN